MRTEEAHAKWNTMAARTRQKVVTQHYNGTCCCYGPRGAVVPGSRETGKNCLVACIGGWMHIEVEALRPRS